MMMKYTVAWPFLMAMSGILAGFCLADEAVDDLELSTEFDASPVEDQVEAAGHWTTQNCLLEPHMVVELSSPVTGVIAVVKVERGDRVREGALVVQLRSEVEQAMVNLNRSQLEFEQTTVSRNQELFDQKLISPQERDELELKSEISRLELEASRARLGQKRLTSPIKGVVLERFKDPGEYVGEEPILEIASLDPINVEAVLPMRLFGTIHAESRAEVFVGYPVDALYPASIVVVDQAIDAGSGTFNVRLSLANPDNRIPTGLKCKLRIYNGDKLTH